MIVSRDLGMLAVISQFDFLHIQNMQDFLLNNCSIDHSSYHYKIGLKSRNEVVKKRVLKNQRSNFIIVVIKALACVLPYIRLGRPVWPALIN